MENQFILSHWLHPNPRDFILDVPIGQLPEYCLGSIGSAQAALAGDHGKLPIAAINIKHGEWTQDELPQHITKTSNKRGKCLKSVFC